MQLAACLVALTFFGVFNVKSSPIKITARQACPKVELIHAAGTTESGLGIVGTPVSQGLEAATAAEFVATVTAGASLMQQRIAATLSSCPDTSFILSGYSKGAMVVHHTAAVLSPAEQNAVKAVAVFGDPDIQPKGIAAIEGLADTWPHNNPSVNSIGVNPSTGTNVFSACGDGDEFCDAGGLAGLAVHLAYPTNGDTDKAVAFLAGVVA
ncbi:hypothetical protein RQP46_009047 [Phenoliferia psychrophenolica]